MKLASKKNLENSWFYSEKAFFEENETKMIWNLYLENICKIREIKEISMNVWPISAWDLQTTYFEKCKACDLS